VQRLDTNPLLTPADIAPTRDDLEIFSTLNPGTIRVGDEILLLVRVAERPRPEPGYVSTVVYDDRAGEVKVVRHRLDDPDLDTSDPRVSVYKGRALLTSMSHIHVARSRDGKAFTFDPRPGIYPSRPEEAFGCEDARVAQIDGRYYVNYSAVSSQGVSTALSVTDDFRTFEKLGVIFTPYNKDVCLFPEKIGGMYVCRHRPFRSMFNLPCVWTAYSPDLLCWGRHALTMEPEAGTWRSERVGCGGTPIRTDEGWLEIYHAADQTGRYCLGAMLSDLERPETLLHRSRRPILEPEADYERAGVYGNCVFSNGCIADGDGTLTIYYGAADSICAAAVTTVDEMIAAARS